MRLIFAILTLSASSFGNAIALAMPPDTDSVAAVAQRNDWYEPCVMIDDRVCELGIMPINPLNVDAHIRVRQPEPYKNTTVTLAWNAADTLNYAYARLGLTGHDDDIYLGKTVLTLGSVTDGVDSPTEQHAFDPSAGYESVRLVYDGFSARIITAGGAHTVEYDKSGPGRILMLADSPVMCQRLTALGTPSQPIRHALTQNADSLCSALASSTDKMEGIWEYMDRDISPGAATLGGRYRLATAKSADGGYDIIYLGGAEINPGQWPPLSIKGHLTPTIFTGNCDLRWTDANGLILERECNAQLDPNGAILTLRFPLQKAQIRLRRIP